MADTVRPLSALQILLASNVEKAVSAQDLRDFLISALQRYNRTVTTTPTTLDTNDRTVFVDATSGAVTLNLPAAAASQYAEFVIHKIDSSANDVIIDANSTEHINGVETLTLDVQYDCARLECDGSEWFAFIGA